MVSTQAMAGRTRWNGRALAYMSGSLAEAQNRKTFLAIRPTPKDGVIQQHLFREVQAVTLINTSRTSRLSSILLSAVGTVRADVDYLC